MRTVDPDARNILVNLELDLSLHRGSIGSKGNVLDQGIRVHRGGQVVGAWLRLLHLGYVEAVEFRFECCLSGLRSLSVRVDQPSLLGIVFAGSREPILIWLDEQLISLAGTVHETSRAGKLEYLLAQCVRFLQAIVEARAYHLLEGINRAACMRVLEPLHSRAEELEGLRF